MKKILLASMIALGTLGLTSCSNTNSTDAETATETETVTPVETPAEDATLPADTAQAAPADTTGAK